MSDDDDLACLFREGPTADRDEGFAGLVMADVARLRRRANAWLALRALAGAVVLGALAVFSGGDLPLPDLTPLEGAWRLFSAPQVLQGLGVLAVVADFLRRRIRIVNA